MEQEIIDRYMDILLADLKGQYNRIGLRASGRYEDTLETKVDIRYGKITVDVLSEEYSQYLVDGREPGMPPVDAIEQWVRDKGLSAGDLSDRQLAWAIATKIKKEGITVPNRYNDGTLLDPVDYFKQNYMREMVRELGQVRLIRGIKEFRQILRNSKLSRN